MFLNHVDIWSAVCQHCFRAGYLTLVGNLFVLYIYIYIYISAHAYLGLAVLFVVALKSAFDLGEVPTIKFRQDGRVYCKMWGMRITIVRMQQCRTRLRVHLKVEEVPVQGFPWDYLRGLDPVWDLGLECWSYSKSGSCFLTVVVTIFGFLFIYLF